MQANSFKELPKIELHLHLDCSLSFDVVKQIDSNITLKDYKKLLDALLTLQDFNIFLLNDLVPRAN